MTLHTKTIIGFDIANYLMELANLRIVVFKDYPYLYLGNLTYEKNYLKRYAECDTSILILAFDNEKIVGASTGMPLRFEMPELKNAFQNQTIPLDQIFYLGESILLPSYRGQGIYKTFFSERERMARQTNCSYTTFCAVERPNNHPAKPADYQPLDLIWQKYGYTKHPELQTEFSWQEIDALTETSKPMIFWLKKL